MVNNKQSDKSMKESLLRILGEITSYRWQFILVIVATLLAAGFGILGPRQLGQGTTLIFEGLVRMIQGTGGIDFSALSRVLGITFAIYLISGVFSAVQGYMMNTITETVGYNLRRRMQEKINRMPMSYFESRPYGEILSRIVNDVDTLAGTLSQSATQLLSSITNMVGIAVIMFTINKTLAVVVYLIVPLALLLIRLVTRYSQKYFRSQQRVLGKINGYVEEIYSGQQIVKAYNQAEESMAVFDRDSALLADSVWRSQFFSGILFPVMTFVSNVGYVAVVIIGAYLSIIGQIEVGMIQAFTQYVNRFTQPITQITQIVNLMQQMVAAAERVYEFLDAEEEDQLSGQTLNVDQIEGFVDFDHVEFSYEPGHKIIHDFNASIKPDQKVAIVGPTGAGKSTIVKLLMRFYDLDAGQIRLDHEDISKYSRYSYQQALAMVLQDTWLFEGTVRENISYGRLDATDEEVVAAAKAARCHHFIMGLPGGYDFMLKDSGTNISQGQRQLLTIARAMIANRPLLILDEATSSVDTRTELLIQEAMDELMRGRTSFVIAHRLSTIKNSDLILYLEDGDVVEQGTHDELMQLNQRYANLYRSQFDKVS